MSDEAELLDYLDINDAPDGPPTIPADNYLCRVVDADARVTKEGGGIYLNYRAVVQAGDHAGTSIFGMWSLKNAEGKQDQVWRTKGDWKRLEFEPGKKTPVELADAIKGLEGYVKVTEEQKRDRDGTVLDEKENRIRKWLRSA